MKGMMNDAGINSPCQNCRDRRPCCHDACKAFAEFRSKVDEAKARMRKAQQDEDYARHYRRPRRVDREGF